jgi:hypothetical protein
MLVFRAVHNCVRALVLLEQATMLLYACFQQVLRAFNKSLSQNIAVSLCAGIL